MMKYVLCLLLFFSTHVSAKTIIKVGAYNYPPFVEWRNGKPLGLINDFVTILNNNQDKYIFSIVETTSNRRYYDLENKYYDIIFFENILWSWDKSKVHVSKIFLQGGEVFIAKKIPGRNQSYFSDIKNKRIRAYHGYHYAFLDYSTDPKDLKKWNVELTQSHDGNIQAVIDDRADLAMITLDYLKVLFKTKPTLKNEIIVSSKFDQTYKHSAMIRTNSNIQLEEVNALLVKIQSDPAFKSIFLSMGQ